MHGILGKLSIITFIHFGVLLSKKEYLFVSVCVYFFYSFANSFVQVKMQYC